ncbi:MAG: type IV conjugative transfer system protein TraL [Succinivibrionaceae bacterium]
MEAIEFPHGVDEPPIILLWSIDELLPLIVGILIGMQIGQALICTIIGLFISKLYSRFLDIKPQGYLLHLLYWYGIYFRSYRTMPNPFKREFV